MQNTQTTLFRDVGHTYRDDRLRREENFTPKQPPTCVFWIGQESFSGPDPEDPALPKTPQSNAKQLPPTRIPDTWRSTPFIDDQGASGGGAPTSSRPSRSIVKPLGAWSAVDPPWSPLWKWPELPWRDFGFAMVSLCFARDGRDSGNLMNCKTHSMTHSTPLSRRL